MLQRGPNTFAQTILSLLFSLATKRRRTVEPLWNDVVSLDCFETATQLCLEHKLKSITSDFARIDAFLADYR